LRSGGGGPGESILARLTTPAHLALFFDYDGTLAPFAPRPELAVLPVETRDVLRTLAARDDVTVGIISSRVLREVVAFVDLEGVLYAGLTGLEVRLANGETRSDAAIEACRPVLQKLARELHDELQPFPGAWLEDKDGALAVHHRALDDERLPELRDRVQNLITPRETLRLESNAFTLEVWPRVRMNKGKAVQVLLAETAASAFPFYAGDDTNDAPALQRVRELGGIAVGVGPAAPDAAEYRLETPRDLRALLEGLAQARGHNIL
jgi:trehalose-phosphatase